MFKSYLRIALRNFLKHKTYSFINVAGLAIGMTCCLLIMLFVQDELSYDRYHEKASRIYRLALALHSKTEPVKYFAVTAGPMAPTLLKDYPEIERAVRLSDDQALVSYREKRFYESRIFWAGEQLFEVFSFKMIKGDPHTALHDPRSIVLTEAMAEKYFGGEEALGKTITLADTLQLAVSGIVQNVPHNSHFVFDFLIPYALLAQIQPRFVTNWYGHGNYTYLLLAKGASAAELESKLAATTARYIADLEKRTGLAQIHFLQPLTGIHLHSNLRSEIVPNSQVVYVYIFSGIALFVLAIACINFMNLATARFAHRAKEVGLRKVIGAQRVQLIKQFLGESLSFSILALLIAVVVVELSLPLFNTYYEKQLSLRIDNAWLLLTMLGITLLVGMLAGSYPAFFLSALKPVDMFKGQVRAGARGVLLRRGLVVLQFSVSIVLIVGTAIIHAQLRYMQNQSLGFKKEQLVAIPLRGDETLRERIETLKTELLKQPTVRSAAASSRTPGRGLNNVTIRPEGASEGQSQTMLTLIVDPDFVATYGIEMAAGRNFTAGAATDSNAAFILNEAAVKELGWGNAEAAIGKAFDWNLSKPGAVIGVTKNFHFSSLQEEIRPIVMHILPNWYNYLSLRIQTDEVPATLAAIESTWQRVFPNRPFEYFFVDADYDRQYRNEERIGRLFGTFSLLAIFIACLGLFGLAAFAAEQRTKEIGIRKVLGASMAGIIGLLSKDFVKLVLAANLIAWPVAYFAMNKWLQDFAYRVEIGWWIFALAGGLALLIALLTVSTQALKAALANPVEALRYE